jgi:hypothetical protein
MKKKVILFLVAAFCLTAAKAQRETEKFSFGLGLEAGIPTGKENKTYATAIGLTARLSWLAGPGFVTVTGGAVAFTPKSNPDGAEKAGLEIPIRVGYKYIIQHHLFVMGELGYAHFTSYYGLDGNVASVSSGSMTFTPSVGYTAGMFEIGLRYGLNLSGDEGVFGLRVGLNF